MIGLCDCNSFYASCETLFRPDLRDRPVVVLSNNDGCVVALNRKAKLSGVRRGDAYFEVKDRLEETGCAVFSSNYALYQDISDRVMEILRELCGDIMQYSIDEAFFTWPVGHKDEIQQLRDEICRRSGIDVSIGLSWSKTLAKIANHIAKNNEGSLCLESMEEIDTVLKKTPCSEVWNIGPRTALKLRQHNILDAYTFKNLSEQYLMKNYTVTGYSTALELRGHDVIDISPHSTKSICSGITFDGTIDSRDDMIKALSAHCMTLSEKLDEKGMMADRMTVLLFTNRFHDDFLSPCGTMELDMPTCYAPRLAACARMILNSIWRDAPYHGCRIFLTSLERKGARQFSLFSTPYDMDRTAREDRMASCVSEISHKYGRGALACSSSELKGKNDQMKRAYLSPCYTTRWEDIPVARLT